jgi:hypothetical protein
VTTGRCKNCGDQTFRPGGGWPPPYCDRCKAQGFFKYGPAHQKRRAATIEEAYYTPCVRCGAVMLPTQELHLDHVDGGGADDYLGFSHARCNESAGSRRRWGRRPQAVPVAPAAPREPGPEPSGLEHFPGCSCRDKAQRNGSWPTRCW